MSLDERIKHIAQQAIAEAGTAPSGAADSAAVRRLGFQLDAALTRVDDLHKELHAVATRLAALEQAAATRTRQPRKATGE